jgi:hypothetical protein
MCFNLKKTLRVPVEEPASLRASSPGASPQSLEQWVQSPANVMGVVFTADKVNQLQPDLWRIQVLRLPLLEWWGGAPIEAGTHHVMSVRLVCSPPRFSPPSPSDEPFAATSTVLYGSFIVAKNQTQLRRSKQHGHKLS